LVVYIIESPRICNLTALCRR